MTNEEFKKTSFGVDMKAMYRYDRKIHSIVSVDFPESLIGLKDKQSDSGIQWVRCENVQLISNEED